MAASFTHYYIPAITPIYDDSSCEMASFNTLPSSISYVVGEATASFAMPILTSLFGEFCHYSETLTSTSHTTINYTDATIDVYTTSVADVGTHSMVFTVTPANFNDYVADVVYNFDVIITSGICDAIILISS